MDSPSRAGWVAIARNPTSGSGGRQQELLRLIRSLHRFGLRCRMFSDRARLVHALADSAARERCVGVVAAGGDGTLRDVLNRCPGLPVALLPLGTENLVARYLNIPPDGEFVARMIAAGKRRMFDLGFAGDHRFTLMASLGFDADVVHRLHASRRSHISKSTYLWHIFRSLCRYEHPPFHVWLDDDPQPITARLGVVTNIPGYAFGIPLGADARGDDGLLDVTLFERGSTFQMARYLYNVMRRTTDRLPDVHRRRVKRLRIASDRPVPVQADGDPAGNTPIEIRVQSAGVELFVNEA